MHTGVADKRQHVQQMGMTGLLSDVEAQQQRLHTQYLDAQAASASLLRVGSWVCEYLLVHACMPGKQSAS